MTIARANVFLIVAAVVLAGGAFFYLGRPQNAQRNAPRAQNRDLPERFRTPDRITAKIRSVSQKLVRIEISSPADRTKAEALGEIVQDFGSFVIAVRPRSSADDRGLKIKTIDSLVSLPGRRFDPLVEPASATETGDISAETGKNYYIVQFGGVPTDEWTGSLKQVGIDVIQFVAGNAFIVYGDGEAMGRVVNHSRVRWAGRLRTQDRLPNVLLRQLEAFRAKTATNQSIAPLESTDPSAAIFDIAVFSRSDAGAIASRVAAATGGSIKKIILLPNNFFNILRVEAPVETITNAAALDDVFRIDAWQRPLIEDERAAQIVAGNYTSTSSIAGPGYNPLAQFGANGQGVTVSVVDDGVSIPGTGGFYISSANAVDGPLRGAAAGATGGHGHLNASIIAGASPFGNLDPLGYNYGLGIAPAANVINIPLLVSGYAGSEADAFNDTVVTVGPNGAVGTISNNSWGSGVNGNAYDSYTAQFDGFVRDASYAASIDPLLLIFSAGNSGPGALSLTRPKAAKNLIAVGNSENLRTELGGTNANNIDDLRGTSSRGPTADGRIKPDIVAPGSYITGGRAGNCSSVTSCFETNHAYSVGTSHAAPQVAGAAALFAQFWKNGNAGRNPSPALVKAAIINTGQEMSGLSTNAASIPNGTEGWGRINLKYMLNTGVPMRYVNESATLSNVGETSSLAGVAGDPAKPIRISLVWTDPPGVADPALVNNLDLAVTVNGTTYRGNVFSGGQSTAGGSFDTVNNVENVWLPAGTPAGAPISIQVTAAALNGDGVLGNTDLTDQNFAIVAYNVAEQPSEISDVRADFDGDGKTDLSVWRPSDGVWYILRSSDSTFSATAWGAAGDVITPGDYDADGKTDFAVWRPSNGVWYVNRTTAGLLFAAFGQAGDIPVAADYDGDGKYDIAVYRPGEGVWYRLRSSEGFDAVRFGTTGDKPVPGKYDADSRADVAVYRPSEGNWYLLRSSAGFASVNFGLAGDRPAAADYDGDNVTDIAVYRPSAGSWFLQRSTAGFYALNFGVTTDVPAPGDFDGDGRYDIGVFRGAEGAWYQMRSQTGFAAANWGSAGDVPIPSGYLPQ